MIESPFYHPSDRMFLEIEETLKKYGYKTAMLIYMEPVDEHHGNYMCQSNFVSDGLADYLYFIADDINRQIDEKSN